MQEEKYNIESGEEKAWRELMEADPSTVARASLASYDPLSGAYTLRILGEDYLIDPAAKSVRNITNPGRKPEYFLNLSAPIYLTSAREVPPSGELVKELKGGGFFFRGSHTLPLDALALKYGTDKALFEEAGAKALGGWVAGMGDTSVVFDVFPRVRMAFVLWLLDSEFPARASLLFDSNADRHMALDVVWAMSLLSCQRMLG